MIKLETERLILREFNEDDVYKLHEICNEENILKWLPDWNVSFEMRMSWYKWIKGMYSKSTKYDVRIMLAIELKTNNQLIGMVGIGNKEEVDNEVEVAYFVTESMSGNGYMTEAVAGIKNWALHQYDLPYLIAIVEYDNISSQRVIEKNGFKLYDSKKIINSGETEMKPFYYYKYENY